MSGRRGKFRVPVIFPLPLLTSRLLATCLLRPVTGQSLSVPHLGQTTGHQSIDQEYRPDVRPRYDRSSHRTISVRSPIKVCRVGHLPFYVWFSHRPRYDHSGHRTMSVRSGQGVPGQSPTILCPVQSPV